MNEQSIRRQVKLNEMKSRGIPAYPERYHTNYDLHEAAVLEDGTSGVRVAGRIIGIRSFSQLSFITISDIHGSLQLLLKKEEAGEEAYEEFHALSDIGDFIGVEGKCIRPKQTRKHFESSATPF